MGFWDEEGPSERQCDNVSFPDQERQALTCVHEDRAWYIGLLKISFSPGGSWVGLEAQDATTQVGQSHDVAQAFKIATAICKAGICKSHRVSLPTLKCPSWRHLQSATHAAPLHCRQPIAFTHSCRAWEIRCPLVQIVSGFTSACSHHQIADQSPARLCNTGVRQGHLISALARQPLQHA